MEAAPNDCPRLGSNYLILSLDGVGSSSPRNRTIRSRSLLRLAGVV